MKDFASLICYIEPVNLSKLGSPERQKKAYLISMMSDCFSNCRQNLGKLICTINEKANYGCTFWYFLPSLRLNFRVEIKTCFFRSADLNKAALVQFDNIDGVQCRTILFVETSALKTRHGKVRQSVIQWYCLKTRSYMIKLYSIAKGLATYFATKKQREKKKNLIKTLISAATLFN